MSDPTVEGGDPVASVRIWFTVGDEIIVTDPEYLANLAAEAEDLCAGVEGYPCGGYSAVGTPEALSGWTGLLTVPQTYDLGLGPHPWVTGEYHPTSYGQVAALGPGQACREHGEGPGQHRVHRGRLRAPSVKPVESALKQRMVGTVSFVNLKSALAGDWNLLLEQSRPGPQRFRWHLLGDGWPCDQRRRYILPSTRSSSTTTATVPARLPRRHTTHSDFIF